MAKFASIILGGLLITAQCFAAQCVIPTGTDEKAGNAQLSVDDADQVLSAAKMDAPSADPNAAENPPAIKMILEKAVLTETPGGEK